MNVGLRSERGPILLALMVTTGLTAIETTILATAIPSIVEDLGGFSQFPWLFSIYLLAQAVTVPVYSKLADTIGRKPVILFGIGLFLLGSILCGLAWSMPALIAFRAVQGLGAGAIQPLAITIAGDIYTVAERAKTQGYLASVWAISSVVGPSLGGIFAALDAWRWIFWVNVPLCVLAAWLLIRTLHETVEKREHRIDYAGAILLMLALSALILAILEGGQAWAWTSWQSLSAFALGGALLLAFLLVERRAAEPILPLWAFTRRLLITTTLVGFGTGALLIGLTSYVPTYLEGSIGTPPLLAGLALAALTLGWPIAASISGRWYLRFGFKRTIIAGLLIVILGAAIVVAVTPTPSPWLIAAGCFVVGLGMGTAVTPATVAAQSSVEWNERGVVTGTNMFARSVGSAIGVAVFGAIANSVLAGSTAPALIVDASFAVFVAALVVAAATLVAALAMPKTPVIAH